jgi:hypothetical protein
MPDSPQEDEADDSGPLPLLRSILPEGYENAKRDLDAVFDRAAEEAAARGISLPYAEPVHQWLTTVLQAEYFGETPAGNDLAGERQGRARGRRRTGRDDSGDGRKRGGRGSKGHS